MLKRVPLAQGLTWAVLLFILPLPFIQTLATGLPVIYTDELFAVQMGSIAYVWLLAAIYLSTRPQWLDRLIGLPSIYFIHGMLSIFAIVLAYVHKIGTRGAGLIKLTGNYAFYLFVGLMLYSLIFMAGWLTSRSKPLAWLKRQLERIFHHELSVWLHRLNLLAVLLVFIHVQLIGYITAITPYMFWFDGYSAFVLAVYVYAKIKNAYLLPKAKLIVKRELAPNFFEFTIQMRHPQQLKIAPGDYVFINLPNNLQLKELHPFSVVNAVGTSGKIVLAIRGDGDFTRQIQAASLGSTITVDGSYGKFANLIKDNQQDDLVLVAGGSGVVPMLALIAAYPDRTISLYYSAHKASELIYVQELRQLAQNRANLTLHIQQGRFKVAQEVQNSAKPQTLYLLSGPQKMGHDWQHALLKQQITPSKIYYEEFSW